MINKLMFYIILSWAKFSEFFGIVVINYDLIKEYKSSGAIFVQIRSGKLHTNVKLAGSYALILVGGITPVIFYTSEFPKKSLLLHEVGHIPDIQNMYRDFKYITRVIVALFAVCFNPFLGNNALSVIINKLISRYEPKWNVGTHLFRPEFEFRADDYAASHVGKQQYKQDLIDLVCGLLGLGEQEALDLFRKQNSPECKNFLDRLERLS